MGSCYDQSQLEPIKTQSKHTHAVLAAKRGKTCDRAASAGNLEPSHVPFIEKLDVWSDWLTEFARAVYPLTCLVVPSLLHPTWSEIPYSSFHQRE